jgi:hypothetical protein
LGEPLRTQKKPPKGGFFCGSRRAIRGSLRSYLRGRFAPAWYCRQRRQPLLSLSQNSVLFFYFHRFVCKYDKNYRFLQNKLILLYQKLKIHEK